MKKICLTAVLVAVTLLVAMPSLSVVWGQIRAAGTPSEPAVESPAEPMRPAVRLPDVPDLSPRECPGRYINCMPPVPKEKREMCSREYLDWVKEHCPSVKVVY